MGEVWIREAQRLTPRGAHNSMRGNSESVKAGWHTTESPSGHTKSGNSYFDAMHRVLRDAKAEPHLLWDPVTDELGQYFPLNRSARSFKGVNRDGRICIQVEVVGYAGKPFTRTWKPGPNGAAILRAMRSWGIPDVFPGGPLMRTYGDSRTSRSTANWRKSGHFGHCQAPGNTHWDPGDIDTAALLALGRTGPSSPAPVAPPETKDWFDMATEKDLQRVVDAALEPLKLVLRDHTGKLDRIQREGRVTDDRVNVAYRANREQVTNAVAGLGLPAATVDELVKRLGGAA